MHLCRTFICFFCLLVFLPGISSAKDKDTDAGIWDTIRLRGRAIFRYELREREKFDGFSDEFELDRARFDLRFKPTDDLRLMLELELTSGVELKDAYARYDLHRAFRVQLGHFKKPFSALRMSSRWDLLVPRRGLIDDHVIGGSDFGGFGGRDAGLQVFGRLGKRKKVRFSYALGLFDGWELSEAFFRDPGDPNEDNTSHRDYVGRLQVDLLKMLTVGVSYNHKVARVAYAPGVEQVRSFNAISADVAFVLAGLTLQVEGLWGTNPNAAAGHAMMGGHAILAYRIPILDHFVLTPAFMGEVLDPDDEVEGKHAVRLVGALNFDIGKYTRVVLSAEGGMGELVWIQPEYTNWDQPDAVESAPRKVDTRVMLQLQLRL